MSDKKDEKNAEEEATIEEELASDLDDMLKTFGQSAEESEKDDSEEETASEDVEEEEEEDKEKEISDEKGTEEEEAAKGEEDEEDSSEEDSSKEVAKDPDERDQVITDLREKLAAKEAEEPSEKEKEDEPKPEEELTFEEQDFLGDLEVDDVLESKEALNKLLQIVYTKGITETRKVLGEHVLREIPSIVASNVAMVSELNKTREEFYAENPDLEPFKKVVSTVFEEVSAKHPDKEYKELLVEVGKEARKRLELHKDVTPTKSEKKPPKLPEKKSSRASKDKPDVSGLESELSDMSDVVRR